jgi:hypothetical protein
MTIAIDTLSDRRSVLLTWSLCLPARPQRGAAGEAAAYRRGRSAATARRSVPARPSAPAAARRRGPPCAAGAGAYRAVTLWPQMRIAIDTLSDRRSVPGRRCAPERTAPERPLRARLHVMLHARLHAITCIITLHYMLSYMPVTCVITYQITCCFTCHYILHYIILHMDYRKPE